MGVRILTAPSVNCRHSAKNKIIYIQHTELYEERQCVHLLNIVLHPCILNDPESTLEVKSVISTYYMSLSIQNKT